MRTTIIALSLALAACGGHDIVGPPDPAPTAIELLDEQPWFAVTTADQWIEVTARLNRGSKWIEATTPLVLERGEISLATDDAGDLTIAAIDLRLADVVAGEKVISDDGLHLTDLHLYLEETAVCAGTDWADDGDSCYAHALAELTLGWALEVGPDTYALGAQHLADIAFELGVVNVDGRLTLDVVANAEGVFWEWAGIIEFTDLRAQLRAIQLPAIR